MGYWHPLVGAGEGGREPIVVRAEVGSVEESVMGTAVGTAVGTVGILGSWAGWW